VEETNHEDAIAQRNVEDFVQMDELQRRTLREISLGFKERYNEKV